MLPRAITFTERYKTHEEQNGAISDNHDAPLRKYCCCCGSRMGRDYFGDKTAECLKCGTPQYVNMNAYTIALETRVKELEDNRERLKAEFGNAFRSVCEGKMYLVQCDKIIRDLLK